MAKTQVFPGPPTGRRFCAVPATVKSGDFLLVGDMAGVALNDYQANTTLGSGTTVDFTGTHVLTVVAKSALSPAVGAAAGPGDKLYLDGGVLDATTNCTTGGTIDRNTGGTHIGWLDPQYLKTISSSATDANAQVKLKGID